MMVLRFFLLTNLVDHTIPINSPLPFNIPTLYNVFHFGNFAVQYTNCLTWYAYSNEDVFEKSYAEKKKIKKYVDDLFQNKMDEIDCFYKVFNSTKKKLEFTVSKVPFFKRIEVFKTYFYTHKIKRKFL